MSSSDSFNYLAHLTLTYQHTDDHGRPPFLQRNLTQVLYAHENELKISKASKASGLPADSPKMRTRRSTAFEVPEQEVLHAAVQQSGPPRLRVMPIALERMDVNYMSDEESQAQNPAWLPAPDSISLSCTVGCMAYASDGLDVKYQQSQSGKLISKRGQNGQMKFLFKTDEPFLIDVEKFFVSKRTTRSAADGSRWSNKEFAANAIKVTIVFNHLEDAALFESELDVKTDKSPLESLELRAIWVDLPECPPENHQIQIYTKRNGVGGILRKWGARIDIAWPKPTDTALQIVHKASDQLSKIEQTGAPMSRQTRSTEKNSCYCITYEITGTGLQSRKLIKDNLKCIFCDSKRPYPSFASLQFHYTTYHEELAFTVLDGPPASSKVIEKVVNIDRAERQRERASNHMLDFQEMDWVRPNQPFDLERYLNGDLTWIKHGAKAWKRVRPQREKSSEPVSAKATPVTESDTSEYPHELPKRQKVAFRVPRIHNVTCFRTSSKRLVEAGELLEESDDDIDTSYVKLRHVNRQTKLPSGVAKDFILLYNSHVSREGPYANKHLPHMLLRFSREHSDVLRLDNMLPAYEQKLNELRARHKITDKNRADCLAIVRGSDAEIESRTEQTGNEAGTRDTNNTSEATTEQHPSTDVEHSNMLLPPLSTNGHSKAPQQRTSTCICGKPCTTARGVIYCSSPQCSRSEFHVACVGLSKRVPGWYCTECRPAVTRLVAPVAVM